MTSVTEKKNEIDLLRASFTPEEIVFDDPLLIEELDLLTSQNLPIEDRDVRLTLRIAFPELSITVLLKVCLPRGYPQVRPSVLLRVRQSACIINEKALNTALNEWLKEVCAVHEPILCSLIDWLHSALDGDNRGTYLGRDAFKNPRPNDRQLGEPSKSSDDAPEKEPFPVTEICYWIFSHHIRNPKKRKVIVDWARELGLTGCCLPGKPGIVVVEGPEDKAEEYWKRIRVLTWKRIQVKDREEITKRRFADGFFEVGGTLAEKIGYMRSHGVTQERIAQHFGFKIDVSETRQSKSDGGDFDD